MSTKNKKTFKEKISWLMYYMTHDIFRVTESELSKSMRFFVRLLKKIILSVRGFFSDKLMIKASALTYYTVLALVPILALIFAIGRGFGFQGVIENWVVELLGNNKELVPIVMGFVGNYLSQTRGGLFVGFGIGVLLWAVISMFRQIEFNFNSIWNVKKNRSIIRQFTTYITIMIIVPLLIVASNGLTIKVDEYVELIAHSTVGSFFIPIYQFLVKLSPFIIYWILFTLVYLIIPNTKVKIINAIMSGVVIGTAFLLLQFLYVNGQISLSKYNAVYGSFAAIPMLLFWLQLSWIIVLYGAELCYVSQNLVDFSFENDTKNISPRYKDYTLLIVLKIIVDKFSKGEKPVTAEEISSKYNIPIKLVENHIRLLMDTDIVSAIDMENENMNAYQPAMDIHKITLQLVCERVRLFGSEKFKIYDNQNFENIWNELERLQNVINEQASKLLIKDL